MKKLIVAAALILTLGSLSGCGGFENTIAKTKVNLTKGDFKVTVYSGGQVVKTYDVRNGYVSTEENSDGWFFNYNGKLVRVTGTVLIEQL